ncbi:MAG: PrsW family intramembrane metalloprotease [Solobacterium sp.]|nr:PrsW family intramembrane metalloprotease [Solobacterium sp.]
MFNRFNISYDSPRLLVAAAVIPALFLMYYIYRHDRIEKEPGRLLARLVLFGLLSAVAAGVIEALWEYFVFPQIPFPSVEAEIIALATMVGLAEEGTKLFFLKRRTWRSPEFNYRFDGIVYAVFVSLGCAAIENIMYVMQYGMAVAVSRAFLAVPAHFGFAVTMGTFYGRAKVCDVRRDGHMRRVNLALAYLLPVSMHAFYDAMAMLNSDLATNMFLAFVVICYVLIYRRIKREAREDTLIA